MQDVTSKHSLHSIIFKKKNLLLEISSSSCMEIFAGVKQIMISLLGSKQLSILG